MKTLFTALVLATFTLGAGAAHAATAQQTKMGDCNKQATEKALKGADRKKFMSECLKGGAAKTADAPAPAKAADKPAAAAPAAPAADTKALAPKDAMKACSGAGKGKKGDEYKKFMSDCLKAKGPANMK